MIDEPRLIRALERILSSLTQLGRPVASLFQPGLQDAEIDRLSAGLPFELSEELRAFYRWRNGTRIAVDHLLEDLWVFPGFYLPSLEESIELYREQENQPEWQEGSFPLFADSAGDFYVVSCEADPIDAGPVIGWSHGEPEQDVEYPSLTSMMETLAACFAQNVFFVDGAGNFDMDDDAHERIARQHHPGRAEAQAANEPTSKCLR